MEESMPQHSRVIGLLGLSALLLAACSPTVKLQAPDKPIEINMTVNIKHEILLKVEKDVQQMFQSDKGLF
ncbi:YnbE family lipoprotein [Malikia spinosa]|uniref:YnbE family lipoprotein n=2 Tax=Malikia spinosa TaxID=86180 RepID=A0A7C9NFL4_9BURK|nr:YnbE family lipoprotein [Malikia spinosa]